PEPSCRGQDPGLEGPYHRVVGPDGLPETSPGSVVSEAVEGSTLPTRRKNDNLVGKPCQSRELCGPAAVSRGSRDDAGCCPPVASLLHYPVARHTCRARIPRPAGTPDRLSP